MKRYSVTVSLIITGNHKKTFNVLSENIVNAQIRVLSRIKGIVKTTMFEVLSAAEHCLQPTPGTQSDSASSDDVNSNIGKPAVSG